MTVQIKSLQFEDGAGFDGFYISKLDGWDSSPDLRFDKTVRPQAHGSLKSRGFLESRVVSLSGRCYADSPGKLAHYQSRLSGLLADGLPAKVIVDRAGVSTWAMGQLAAKTEFDIELWGSRATYQLQMWFADPFKYGELHTYAADAATPLTVTAWQHGNFAAYPVLTISGTMPAYSVSSNGKTFQVNKAVTPNHPHSIYMDTGLLLVDGFPVYGVVEQGETWTIPPAEFVSQTLAPSGGTGAMTVTVSDTYI